MSERLPTLVLATRNPDKLREMSTLFDGLPLERILTAQEIFAPEVEEDGETLEDNALKKAREVAEFCGFLCLADDTGLEVDALGGAPGVYSARYAGEDASYEDNCLKLVAELADVEPGLRGARFRTVMALVDPTAEGLSVEICAEGVLEGQIIDEPRGDGGFGYDPIFELKDSDVTLAELSMEAKNGVSHRARAAVAMRALLEEHLAEVHGLK